MRRLLLALTLASALGAQTLTTVTGTLKDLAGNVVQNGQVTFDLRPGIDTTQSGQARFVPLTITCQIVGGAISSIARSSDVVTATLSAAPSPNFFVGATVEVGGVTDAGFDGSFTLTSVSGATLTWAQTAADASSSGGTAANLYNSPAGGAPNGACTVTYNTSLTPQGTYYLVTEWPDFVSGAQFNWYATASAQDISTVVPTPGTLPAYTFVDLGSNQAIGGAKTFTGPVSAKQLDGVLNEEQFDGADVGARINAAYAACPAAGCTITIPAGTYSTGTMIDLSGGKNVVLAGSGMGNTIIEWTGTGAAIKANVNPGGGLVTLRDFTVEGPNAPASGNYGISIPSAQNIVNIERVQVTQMGSDAINIGGNTASINVAGCDLNLNQGYGVDMTGATENVTVARDSIYANGGGVHVSSGNLGATIRDNDIEGGSGSLPSSPLLDIQGPNVVLSGNTLGLVSGATATVAASLNGGNITDNGGTFSVGASGQTAIAVGSAAANVALLGPQVSGASTGTGIAVASGALNTVIIAPNYSGLSTDSSDSGTNTTIWSRASDSKLSLYGTLCADNGAVCTDGAANITLGIAGGALVDGAGGLKLQALSGGGNLVEVDDTSGHQRLTVNVDTGAVAIPGSLTIAGAAPPTTAQLAGAGSLTTTSATTDNVAVTWADAGTRTPVHCALTPTNSSAASNIATTYISAKSSNQVTVTHTATSGMTYDITCTPN